MDMAGEQLISLPQRQVWDALNDAQVLKECIPGCESITQVGDNQYSIVMTAAVGPVKAKFTGSLTLSDINPPDSYSLAFTGSGGAAGFGKGGARVSLTPEGNGTRLVYTANAQVGGKLAQVGSRLIDSVAKKVAEEFFARFKAALPADAQTPPVTPVADTATRSKGGFRLTPFRVLVMVIAATLLAIVTASWAAPL